PNPAPETHDRTTAAQPAERRPDRHVFARATSSQRTLRGEWHPSFESASQAVTTLGLVALRDAVGVRNSDDQVRST
ncbi:MAG: hypothetical protein WA970_00780, partial [Gammaproteobacteria bacterium]